MRTRLHSCYGCERICLVIVLVVFFYLFFFSLFESGCFEHFPITIITTGGDVICILAMPWNSMQKPIGFNLSSFIIFSIAVNFVCFGAFYIFDLRHT